MEGALERVPALESTGVRMVNGPESFTPDNQYILGEAPELRKYYVAAGFNSSGIASAGGAGRALADWIVHDGPQSDLWAVDIRRFGRFHSAPAFLRDRTFETLGLHYQIPWPKREMQSARPLRRSPLFQHLKDAGAFFGNKFGQRLMRLRATRRVQRAGPSPTCCSPLLFALELSICCSGWERPNFFDPAFDKTASAPNSTPHPAQPSAATPSLNLSASSSLSSAPSPPPSAARGTAPSATDAGPKMVWSFGKPNWLPLQAREHEAARTRVALFDQSSFAKILVQGRDAGPWLDGLCSADLSDAAMPDGKLVYTALLNDAGGMESDCTVTRIAWDTFMLVTSTGQATRDLHWLRRNLDAQRDFVTLSDVSGAYAVLSLMGPSSRQLLQRCTSADVSNSAFPFGCSREIDVGYALVRANRVTYVGELGWELYVPVEFAAAVYETLHNKAKGNGNDEVSEQGGREVDSVADFSH